MFMSLIILTSAFEDTPAFFMISVSSAYWSLSQFLSYKEFVGLVFRSGAI